MVTTGSGKSLACPIPLIQRLDHRHSSTLGAREHILPPTRELALESSKRSQSLRWGVVIRGDSLDEQSEMIKHKPATRTIIATPSRLLHFEPGS
ncbi:hypothetical protein PENSPDRAFT_711643 [Peniophora sp. CONT]|nr:hypothetical protein PENSPDRAFT_711643 [Peniophora sp. CONT]